MSNRDVILEVLDSDRSAAWCDDCLSILSGVKPRQQVYSICDKLAKQGIIRRAKGGCTRHGGSNKLVNSFAGTVPPSAQTQSAADRLEVDVEKLRNSLVRVCQELLKRNKLEVPGQLGIGPLIGKLYDEGVVPRHQVNMMRTICNLRNAHVFDGVEIGPREAIIASKAWEIIEEWLKSQTGT